MLETQCCIVGGGPAGLMAGLLLARAVCRVVVLEKHADFLRDFRGDTIHPSTLEIMHELGLLERLLELPHEKVSRLSGQFGGESHSVCRFLAPAGARTVHRLDVLWFRLSRRPGDTAETMGRFEPGAIIVSIKSGDYWQCAFVIPKGGFDRVKAEGLPAFRARLGASRDTHSVAAVGAFSALTAAAAATAAGSRKSASSGCGSAASS
jgi:2-polyprenyl-6-methoxyphenol hydroxylase-like FAD-dependent oxidoreductase